MHVLQPLSRRRVLPRRCQCFSLVTKRDRFNAQTQGVHRKPSPEEPPLFRYLRLQQPKRLRETRTAARRDRRPSPEAHPIHSFFQHRRLRKTRILVQAICRLQRASGIRRNYRGSEICFSAPKALATIPHAPVFSSQIKRSHTSVTFPLKETSSDEATCRCKKQNAARPKRTCIS